MRAARRILSTIAAAAALAAVTAAPAAAAAPTKFTFSGSGLSADAVFSNLPAGTPVVGRVYTDVLVYGADETTTADGTTYTDDFAYVDVFSYKFDRNGNTVPVSSSFGEAAGDQATFTADPKRLATASLTAQVNMQSCTDRGCRSTGTAAVSVTWTGNGATSTYKSSYRTSDPGQFLSTGRFSGSSRQASATGSVPVLGTATALYASISSGTWSERTICHGC